MRKTSMLAAFGAVVLIGIASGCAGANGAYEPTGGDQELSVGAAAHDEVDAKKSTSAPGTTIRCPAGDVRAKVEIAQAPAKDPEPSVKDGPTAVAAPGGLVEISVGEEPTADEGGAVSYEAEEIEGQPQRADKDDASQL